MNHLECPKCHENLGIVPVEIAQVGNLLCHPGRGKGRDGKEVPPTCDAVMIVTSSGPGPFMELRLATEEEKKAAQRPKQG